MFFKSSSILIILKKVFSTVFVKRSQNTLGCIFIKICRNSFKKIKIALIFTVIMYQQAWLRRLSRNIFVICSMISKQI